jgi:hypothetical protein
LPSPNPIDIERQKIDFLRFVMRPLLVPGFEGFFFMWPLTVLMKQTRQAVHTIKQSIYLDVCLAPSRCNTTLDDRINYGSKKDTVTKSQVTEIPMT